MERAELGPTVPGRNAGGTAGSRALEAAFSAVETRVKLQRAFDAAATFSLPALGIAALGLCLWKTGWTADARLCFELACVLPLVGLLLGALPRVAPLLIARLLDRSLGTPDLMSSAWSFAALSTSARTPFMQACIDHAQRNAERAEAARALPMRRPPALRAVAAIALGVALLAVVRVPSPQARTVPRAPKIRLLQEEDLASFQQEVVPLLLAPSADPSVRDAARDLNALIEALRDEKLDRLEALRQLRGLERRLEASALRENDESLREALRELGRTLGRDSPAQSLADALRGADAAKARTELERLTQKLREQSLQAVAQRKLQQALALAKPKPDAKTEQRMAKARSELDRLLHKRRDESRSDERNERLLREKRRELEQLERDQQQRARQQQQLDALQRELSSAGQSMGAGRNGEAAQHLQQGSKELQKAQNEQTSAEQQRQLRERVQQLRELISKQQQRQQQEGTSGKAGKGEGQRLSLDAFGRAARGDASRDEHGGRKPDGTLLMPAQGRDPDTTLIMPSDDGDGEASGRADAPGSPRAGSGGRPESSAPPSRLPSTRIDTSVGGEQRDGPTRSQVISEAGQHGFASRSYERVHGEYERHAEAVLERDKVPGGYRFYVRRYFQLIRPRKGSDD